MKFAQISSVVLALLVSDAQSIRLHLNSPDHTEALKGIVLNMSVIPGFFIFIAVGLMIFYTLNKKKMLTIEEDLQQRRSEDTA